MKQIRTAKTNLLSFQFRGIRKRAAKLTHIHGFFSRKYSKSSRGVPPDTRAANSTIQQDENAEQMLISEEKENDDEVMEVSDTASNQTRTFMEGDVMEKIENFTNGQDKEKLNEVALSAAKSTENIQLELVKEMAESTSEDDPSTQEEADRLLAQDSPTEINAVNGRPEIGPNQPSLYESSGIVSCCCSFGLTLLR